MVQFSADVSEIFSCFRGLMIKIDLGEQCVTSRHWFGGGGGSGRKERRMNFDACKANCQQLRRTNCVILYRVAEDKRQKGERQVQQNFPD